MADILYHILMDGAQSGPFTVGQLRSMWTEGRITADAHYWAEGLPDWQPVLDLSAILNPMEMEYATPQDIAEEQTFAEEQYVLTQHEPSTPPSTDFLADFRLHPVGYIILLLTVASIVFSYLFEQHIFSPLYLGLLGLLLYTFSFGSPEQHSVGATILFWITPILVLIEAKQLRMGGDTDQRWHVGIFTRGTKQPRMEGESAAAAKEKLKNRPSSWLSGTFCCWIVYLPYYMYRRSYYGAKNLLAPTALVLLPIIVSFVVVVGAHWWAPLRSLPEVDAPEVLRLVQRIVQEVIEKGRTEALPNPVITISSPQQVSYDKSPPKRVGRARVEVNGESEMIFYSIQWENHTREAFQVQLIAPP